MATDSQTTDVPFHQQFTCFLGFDWAYDHHDVVALDGPGRILLDLRLEDTAEGWAHLRRQLLERVGPDLGRTAVAVETCNGPAVERLLGLGCAVFPINPKAAERYRERKAPMGAKSDRLDAWSFADALRTDGHGWRRLVSDDPLTQELRILCRDEIALIQQRTALVCQLKQALHEYYPAALEAFEDWVNDGAWAFVAAFPTPSALVQAGKRRWEKFLHAHKLYRPETYLRRLAVFARANAFTAGAGITAGKSRLALALVAQLQVLQKQLGLYRKAIEALFDRHPDRDIFGSLPGAAEKLAPRLLAELGDNRQRFDDAQGLQCYAGSAPVTKASGRRRVVFFRTGCNKVLRSTVHLWADQSRKKCLWAQVYYEHKREEGKSHACALRCLAQRWLKIVWKMWQSRSVYDPDLHMRNQVKHGSWVVQPA